MTKQRFNFGDLVRVAGYFPRVFQVDGWRTEHWHYPEEEWTDMVYELHDVQTGDWLEADEEDLSIVVPAIMAKDYIAYRLVQNDSDGWPDTYEKEAVKMAKEPRKLTARELSAQ
ncbi:hypothetical protein [Bacillus sp. 03113]|uniref:hypothetical protein n=1 Tax=Bacillus sp. 03113 TaxID=2578211 RepID=UPI001144D960|nr:hypothetical protein [Bacillus sp. 03113]